MKSECSVVLLADRHHGLRDSVRGLLESEFDTVFMVADEASLLEGAGRLKPGILIVDLSLSDGDMGGLLERVRTRSPASKIVMLTVHDERTIAQAALEAGAEGVILKRSLSTDLHPALDALREGNQYLSPGLSK